MELVWGQGPAPCAGLILGEAPGENEQEQGVPFVGLSGGLLNLALESAGMSRDDVYVTNAYKLRPENNRTPNEEELLEHEQYLTDEFNTVKPRFVLALGNVATGVMTGEFTGILSKRGDWVYPSDLWTQYGVPVLPTYHPSYVLRKGGLDSFAGHEFFGDVRKFVEALWSA